MPGRVAASTLLTSREAAGAGHDARYRRMIGEAGATWSSGSADDIANDGGLGSDGLWGGAGEFPRRVRCLCLFSSSGGVWIFCPAVRSSSRPLPGLPLPSLAGGHFILPV